MLMAYRRQSASDSITMLTSLTAVLYLVAYSYDHKSIKTQTNNISLTWTRSGIELRNCSWLCRCWCTIRRYVKSGKSGSGQHGGHCSLVHLACSTPWMFRVLLVLSVIFRFPVLPFEFDSKKKNWTGFFGHWHRPIWCQAILCTKSLWQLEQSRHPLLIRVFELQDLGYGYKFPDGKGSVS